MLFRRKVLTAVLSATAVLGAVAAAGVVVGAGTASAVAHGTSAPAGAFPFAVKFTMTNIPNPDGTHYNSACSGALVARQWVLTAGHCFHDVNRKPVSGPPRYRTTATLGTVDVTKPGGTTLAAVDVRQSGVNDIALVKLAAPVTGITPAAVNRTAPTVGMPLTLAGWGATSSVNPKPSTHLNLGQFAVSSVTGTTALVHGTAPHPDTSACLYDSGAPYFQRLSNTTGRVVGVESDGPDCPHSTPETTARVDVVSGWIASVIGNG